MSAGGLTNRMRKRILAGTIALALVAVLAAGATTLGRHRDPTPYQNILRGQVDAPDGSPRAGRDPANLKQLSLADAARAPGSAAGGRTDRPGRSASEHRMHVDTKDVLGDPKSTGTLSSGCALDYGDPGAQCLPAKAPDNQPLTCAYVVRIFPQGVPVTGRDVFRLDSNRDKTACGPGDAGVP